MTILCMETNFTSDFETAEFSLYSSTSMAKDIIALSMFDNVVYYNAIRAKISSRSFYKKWVRHRAELFVSKIDLNTLKS